MPSPTPSSAKNRVEMIEVVLDDLRRAYDYQLVSLHRANDLVFTLLGVEIALICFLLSNGVGRLALRLFRPDFDALSIFAIIGFVFVVTSLVILIVSIYKRCGFEHPPNDGNFFKKNFHSHFSHDKEKVVKTLRDEYFDWAMKIHKITGTQQLFSKWALGTFLAGLVVLALCLLLRLWSM